MPIDPRIRERRIEVLRAAGRRRLRITLVIASAILAVGAAYVVLHSPLLDVDHVRVDGARHEPVADIVAAANVHRGAPLVFVDTGAVARRVEQLPWIAHATVRRDLPGTLRITVREYVPTAFVRVPGGVELVAATGRVIARVRAAPAGTIEIRGAHSVPPLGAVLSPAGVANVVAGLPTRLGRLVAAVEVGSPVIALDLRSGGVVRLGTLDALAAKGAAALAVLDHLGTAPFHYIDVTAPAAPSSR